MPYIRVATNLVEYSLRGVHTNGRPVTNIYHMFLNPAIGVSREDYINERGNALRDAWQSQVMSSLANNYTFVGVGFIDLNDVDGVTGFISRNEALPITGAQTGLAFTPQVTALVHKRTTSSRQQRDGRLYLSPLIESQADEDGALAPATVTAINAQFAALLSAADESSPGEEADSRVGHWQIPPGPPPQEDVVIVGSSTTITSFQADNLVATQRRRMRG